ncbi:MAG TPA: lamin tail domain-containing protein, partial [Pyrinomonadaceae bacterium]
NYSGTAFTNYYGTQIFIFDKQAAYAGTLSSVSFFDAPVSGCTAPFEGKLGCGFTMAPTVNEENTTPVMYMAEDWDSQDAQLRLTKITGTPSAPVLTVGTQFPQSPFSWRFNAARIATSGGYAPQKDSLTFTPSTQRLMTNDSRIQNAVLRNGALWTTHTVMLAATPTPAGVAVGGTANPDIRSGVQWWKIDPTIETGLATPPLDRGRLEDPSADNCHNGNGGHRTTGTCLGVANQVGQFYAYPNISVNVNNDVLIGFSQFSPLTYPSSGYMLRRSTDAAGTFRDPVVYRPGQANYNIGAGTGNTTGRQNRWGDYSAAQTDPTNDVDFWTIQEYAGTRRDFGIGVAGAWETYWAQVRPSTAAPSNAGTLKISEFRLRGPQGARDEYVELSNPGATPIVVNTTDNSEGWALATNNGTTTAGIIVIPNGTVIPANGRLLVTDSAENSAVGLAATYSLSGYAGKTNPATLVRGADGDINWSFDIADDSGVAIFRTANVANFSAATRMDAAGFNVLPAGSLYKEGVGIPAISTSTPTGQYALYRDLRGTGSPQDTDANENDFLLVDTAVESLGTAPSLGAPGPENLESPIQSNATIKPSLVDPGCNTTAVNPASPTACVRERNTTPVTNGSLGTLTIRRRFTNQTGQAVPRLRFRVVEVTTLFSPGYGLGNQADLRVLSSATVTASLSGGGTTTIQGLTLEEPPTQPNGGGNNSSLNAG